MKILFWINKGTVYCRITINGKRAEISTGLKAQRLNNSGRTGDSITDVKLSEIEYKLRKCELVLSVSGDPYDALDVKESYERANVVLSAPRLLDIMQEKDKIYKATKKKLEEFLQGNPKLTQLDQQFADSFGQYLVSSTSLASANVYFSKLVASLNQAIKDYPRSKYPDMIEEIPFLKPEILAQQSSKGNSPKYLTLMQYNKLKSLKLESIQKYYALCFLFQCETGMAMADFNRFVGYIEHTINGSRFIRYNRIKTGEEAIVPWTKEADKLWWEIQGYKQEPKVTERAYNYQLKRIGEQLGIENMTSHWARHTFATLKLIDGYSMESISKMLGHSSIKTTEKIYAKVTIDKIVAEKKKIG